MTILVLDEFGTVNDVIVPNVAVSIILSGGIEIPGSRFMLLSKTSYNTLWFHESGRNYK